MNEQYYTECPGPWGEWDEWLQFADEHAIVGYGDITPNSEHAEWVTRINPAYLRRFAELVEYAYGEYDWKDSPRGSVELGLGYDTDGHVVCLIARDPDSDDSNGVMVATRIKK